MATSPILDKGTLSFSIEGRILRELGERLVKQPEVALTELIKNSYDADATECSVAVDNSNTISISDDGTGMTLDQFIDGWMRIGTSSKELFSVSNKYGRLITGEKGIGRFSVRFLGRKLHLETVAFDTKRERMTRLVTDFDWPQFDLNEDLGMVKVPYRLESVEQSTTTGTTLVITQLRPVIENLNLRLIRTATIGTLSPIRSLFRAALSKQNKPRGQDDLEDPGFQLRFQHDGADEDVGDAVLNNFTLRARLRLTGKRLDLTVDRRGSTEPYIHIADTYANNIANLYADIRFFPRRAGAFAGLPVDGRTAQRWISENAGVAIFDRNFRVQPYGAPSDDWLKLQADAARNRRIPRSALALKHFAMSPQERSEPSENWMIRLPQSAQLIGLVQVEGSRIKGQKENGEGLVASADREGFVENEAFRQLVDIVRGAVEAIAYADRKMQREAEAEEQRRRLALIRQETRTAIQEIQENPNIGTRDKARIVAAIAETQEIAERHAEVSRERELQLEVMSLLGVVAGFMTHEFGVAIDELENTRKELVTLAHQNSKFKAVADSFEGHIRSLKEFVTYSSGYIRGTKATLAGPYPVRPRLLQVKRVFGHYAEKRNIEIEINAEPDLMAPPVPASLYNGIALNLYTNALKAVTAKVGSERGIISFRAWNDTRWHYLEVLDTGIGIASSLHDRVFDPLFTTTQSRNDPLGSGMGLGLALVKRGSEAFGGNAEIIEPPADFATCIRVRLPLKLEGGRI